MKHIAIIPDGNRRWAKQKGLAAFLGHKEGAQTFEAIADRAMELEITHLTFWGASINNIEKRDSVEVKYLLDIFKEYFHKLRTDKKTYDKKIRIRALGAWEKYFGDDLKKEIKATMTATESHKEFNLTLMLAYNGTEEMLKALKDLRASREAVTEQSLKANLYTHDLPPVDLVIRTGGEPHLSTGFMMWDTADAALHFSETLWPDFTSEEFSSIISGVLEREKRGGK